MRGPAASSQERWAWNENKAPISSVGGSRGAERQGSSTSNCTDPLKENNVLMVIKLGPKEKTIVRELVYKDIAHGAGLNLLYCTIVRILENHPLHW